MLLLAVADEIVVKTAILWRAFITPMKHRRVTEKPRGFFFGGLFLISQVKRTGHVKSVRQLTECSTAFKHASTLES